MAPYLPGSVVKYSVPTVIVLLSYFWFRRRKTGIRSDTGGSKPIEENVTKPIEQQEEIETSDAVDTSTAISPERVTRANSTPISTPNRKYNRSLSGVETAPIDIVYPPELRSAKSTPAVIPDEDLDFEIEKIKSMRNQYNSPSSISTPLPKTPSPKANSQTESSQSVEQENAITPKDISPVKKTFEHSVVKKNAGKTMTQKNSNMASKTHSSKKNKPKKDNNNQEKTTPQKAVTEMEKGVTNLKIHDLPIQKQAKTDDLSSETKPGELNGHSEIHRKNSGRDSANHSPSDVMMASPSLSSMSDNHSEGSSDSGKGGSDLATPPPSRTAQMAISATMPVTYQFVIPQNLVGKLIGRQGFFVQSIKDACNAHVYIDRHPTNNRLKLCSVDGTQSEIDKALKMIRDKFPSKRYSEVTLEQVHLTTPVPTVSLVPDNLYLKLVEGINNDTIVSCMVAPNHLFMQQPTHPTYPNLNMLTNFMNTCYNNSNCPLLPSPIPENTVCAAFSMDSWYRAIILSTDEEVETSYVKFVDYGGYAYVENDKLRQIRQDFILLPFQAAECFLSNVKPNTDDGVWSEAAYSFVADITKGSLIYTQVAGYSPEEVPLVLCYIVTGHKSIVFLNRKLVDEGYAVWENFEDEEQDETPQEEGCKA